MYLSAATPVAMKKITSSASLLILLFAFACGQDKNVLDKKDSATTSVLKQEEVPADIRKEKKDSSQPAKAADAGFAVYSGSWFDITYPSDFVIRPTAPVFENNGVNCVQTDEAFFTSPDGNVEFFVYSPQWSGDPENYLQVAAGEVKESDKSETKKEADHPGQLGDKTVRWVTVRAKDGSYRRSFISIRAQIGTGSDVHHVFGIKYRDDASYQKYAAAFATFKQSLRQYAD